MKNILLLTAGNIAIRENFNHSAVDILLGQADFSDLEFQTNLNWLGVQKFEEFSALILEASEAYSLISELQLRDHESYSPTEIEQLESALRDRDFLMREHFIPMKRSLEDFMIILSAHEATEYEAQLVQVILSDMDLNYPEIKKPPRSQRLLHSD